jgi:hypothetical protein
VNAFVLQPEPQTSPDERAYRAAELAGERLAAGAPEDDPITHEAIELLAHEFKSLARVDPASVRRAVDPEVR